MSKIIKIIATDFPIDLGDLGEHTATVLGHVEISAAEPNLGLGLSVDAEPIVFYVYMFGKFMLTIPMTAIPTINQSSLVADIEEFIRETIEAEHE